MGNSLKENAMKDILIDGWGYDKTEHWKVAHQAAVDELRAILSAIKDGADPEEYQDDINRLRSELGMAKR